MTAARVDARWSRALTSAVDRHDLVLPAVLLVVQYALSAGFQHRHHPHPGVDAAGWVLLAVGPLALTMRRRHPVAVLWIAFGATLAPSGGRLGYLSLIVAFLVAATQGHRRAAWVVIVVGYVTSLWLSPLVYNQSLPTLASSLLLGSWLAVLVVVAEVVRITQVRAVESRAARQLDERHRESQQRLRMARDLHDVIGHNISLINVQAGVGLDLMGHDPDQARDSLRAIRTVSKEALDELRSMLAALRQDDEAAPRAPAPGLARLPALIDSIGATGLTITTTVTGDDVALPAAVDLAAYRIVQESLTNVSRHAAATQASVALTYSAAALRIEVRDNGRGSVVTSRRAGPDGSGLNGSGITGMRERAMALGGELRVGPAPAGGHLVTAVLPLEGAR